MKGEGEEEVGPQLGRQQVSFCASVEVSRLHKTRIIANMLLEPQNLCSECKYAVGSHFSHFGLEGKQYHHIQPTTAWQSGKPPLRPYLSSPRLKVSPLLL